MLPRSCKCPQATPKVSWLVLPSTSSARSERAKRLKYAGACRQFSRSAGLWLPLRWEQLNKCQVWKGLSKFPTPFLTKAQSRIIMEHFGLPLSLGYISLSLAFPSPCNIPALITIPTLLYFCFPVRMIALILGNTPKDQSSLHNFQLPVRKVP